MKNLVSFSVLAMIMIFLACKKEERMVTIIPEKSIREKFNAARSLSKYSGDVLRLIAFE